MNTFNQICYHIVYSTKHRIPYMKQPGRKKLLRYISGILKNKNCHLYQINALDDHIHILTHLHPDVPLSGLVKDIKLASTFFIKKDQLFENFSGWQNGYSAFTHCDKEKKRLIEYVKNQENRHKIDSYLRELKALLIENGVEFEERFLA